MIVLPELSWTMTYTGMVVVGLHSRAPVVFNASAIVFGVPANVILMGALVVVIVRRTLPLARTLPDPLAPLKVFKAKRSDDVGAPTDMVHTRGLLPLHPGDPEDTLSTTGVPPLTLTETDLVVETLVGTVTTTFTLTVVNGLMLFSSAAGMPKTPGTGEMD